MATKGTTTICSVPAYPHDPTTSQSSAAVSPQFLLMIWADWNVRHKQKHINENWGFFKKYSLTA